MNKIDFALVITAEMCNPNGDPLMFNRPRIDIDGYGEISSVCLKRKIRDRLQEMGCEIFIQKNDRCDDGFHSMKERFDAYKPLHDEIRKKDRADIDKIKALACKKWMDIRTFGQVLPFKGVSASIGVRGPVSIGHAKTLQPIDIINHLCTTSSNLEKKKGTDSNTMYNTYIVRKGVYVAFGSIFPSLAEKTGFSDSDVDLVKESLKILLDNDISSSRPSGSMFSSLYWWEHNGKQGVMPSSKVFHTLHIKPSDEYPYYAVSPEEIPNVKLEIYD